MANENRVSGVAFVKNDGKQLQIGGTITVSPTSVEREGKVGLSGVVGYSEKPRVPFIEIEVITDKDFKAKDFENITNATITAELANGRVYVLRNAWSAPAQEIDGAEGTTTVRFEGLKCIET